MTVIPDLEQKLLRAAERELGMTVSQRRGRRYRCGRVASLVMAGVAISVTLAVGAGALILLGGQRSTTTPRGSATTVKQQLIASLGVLRRPQTAAARRWVQGPDIQRLSHTPGGFEVIPSLAREILLPDHERLLLYVIGSSRSGLTGLGYQERQGRYSGEGACCITPHDLTHPSGPGPLSYQSGRIPPQVYFEIVPDGVSKVRWTFARNGNFRSDHAAAKRLAQRTGRSIRPGHVGAAGSAPLTVTVAVHDNVAAIKLPNRGAATSDTWLNAAGDTIARHGPS